MARSASEIFNELISIKESDSNLDGLTSTSTTALWRLFFYVVAVGMSLQEQIWDVFKKDLEYQKSTTQIYTPQWFNDRVKNQWQYAPGDTDRGVITIDDQFTIGYVIEDATKRIGAFSATKQDDNTRQVTVKVAADDGSGSNPQQLTVDQQSSLRAYIDRIKGVGLLITTVSFSADILQFEIDLYYDGQYVESTTKDNVDNAITEYLQELSFDGTVSLIKMIDKIQAVPGVSDVFISLAQGLPEGGDFFVFNRVYDTKAGFATYDKDNSIINMITE